jgi:hypothetical protein
MKKKNWIFFQTVHLYNFICKFLPQVMQYLSRGSRYLKISTIMSTLDPWLGLGILFIKITFHGALSEMNKHIICNNFLTVRVKKCAKQNILRIMQRTYSKNLS